MSGDDTYKFTPLRMGTPYDNLAAALGILQSAFLATDHCWDEDIVFGPNKYHQSHPLQTALALLMPLLATVDEARWEA